MEYFNQWVNTCWNNYNCCTFHIWYLNEFIYISNCNADIFEAI